MELKNHVNLDIFKYRVSLTKTHASILIFYPDLEAVLPSLVGKSLPI